MLTWEDIKNFIVTNWKAIVEFFDKLWAFAKDTILKDDSPFATDPTDVTAE